MSTFGAVVGASLMGVFAVSTGGSAQGWSPEQWAFLVAAIITSSGSAAAAVVAAFGVKRQRKDMKIPSNGSTPGAYIEALGQILHMAVQLQHPEADIPTPSKVARALSQPKDTEA